MREQIATPEEGTGTEKNLEKLRAGIKARLSEWQTDDLFRLKDALAGENIKGNGSLSIKAGYDGLLASCNEDGVTKALITKLPWAISHDNTALDIDGENEITLHDIQKITKAVLGE